MCRLSTRYSDPWVTAEDVAYYTGTARDIHAS